MTFCLRTCTTISFCKGIYSEREEFACQGNEVSFKRRPGSETDKTVRSALSEGASSPIKINLIRQFICKGVYQCQSPLLRVLF